MKRIWSVTQGLAYLGVLAVLILAIVLAFRAISGGGPAPAATAPADTPSPPPPEETLEPTPTYLPIPTVFNPTPWPEGFTPSPTLVPTATSGDVPYIITDTLNDFSLTVLPGWYASTPSANAIVGVTTIVNYDINLNEQPPGGLAIQISTGKLAAGQTFEEWLSDWLTYASVEELPGPPPTASEPIPYQLGLYQGVTFVRTGPDYVFKEIVLPLSGGRVMSITLLPADSPALPEALVMLSSLTVSED